MVIHPAGAANCLIEMCFLLWYWVKAYLIRFLYRLCHVRRLLSATQYTSSQLLRCFHLHWQQNPEKIIMLAFYTSIMYNTNWGERDENN